mgnify:CR=1 FL=1
MLIIAHWVLFCARKRVFSGFRVQKFPPQGVVSAKFFEQFRVCFQFLAVGVGVVQGQGHFFPVEVAGRDAVLGEGWDVDLESNWKMEVSAQSRQRHAGGVGLSVGGISGDVRGAYIYKV